MDIYLRDQVRKLIGMYLITMANENDIKLLRVYAKPGEYFKRYSKYMQNCASKNRDVMKHVEALPPEGRELFDSIINQLGEGFDIVPVNVESLEDMTNA